MLKHNAFPKLDGKVQSVGFAPDTDSNTTFTVGIAEPGRHEFDANKRSEIIQVTSGEIRINGMPYTNKDGKCVISPGNQVIFEVDEPSSYICHFP